MLILARGRGVHGPQRHFPSAEELEALPDDHTLVDAEFLGKRQPPVEEHICMYSYNDGSWPDRPSGGNHV